MRAKTIRGDIWHGAVAGGLLAGLMIFGAELGRHHDLGAWGGMAITGLIGVYLVAAFCACLAMAVMFNKLRWPWPTKHKGGFNHQPCTPPPPPPQGQGGKKRILDGD